MDKETLSNYGWITICVLVIAVMVALATPFGSYIKSAVENTTQGVFDVEQKSLTAGGLTIANQSFEGGSEPESPAEPTISTFTFTIGDTEYTAEEGMTWAEWCNSEYNIAGFINDGVGIHNSDLTRSVKFVSPNSIITSGAEYNLGTFSG